MAIKLVREFKQNQQLSITPQLKKSIDLLQLSRLEIINRINNEIEENPFLKKDFNNESSSDINSVDFLENLPNELTFVFVRDPKYHQLLILNLDLNNLSQQLAFRLKIYSNRS